jgi:hypothetical protein
MNSSQQKALTDALERIVVCEAITMDLRQHALQGIEDLEMGSAADKMTIRDVYSFTANRDA